MTIEFSEKELLRIFLILQKDLVNSDRECLMLRTSGIPDLISESRQIDKEVEKKRNTCNKIWNFIVNTKHIENEYLAYMMFDTTAAEK